MADPASDTKQPERNPMIRTMKSDVAAFLKKSKPSLVSVLAEQAAYDRPLEIANTNRRPWLLVASACLMGIIGVVVAVFYLRSHPAASPTMREVITPPPVIFFESSTELAIPRSQKSIASALQRSGASKLPTGSFERLILRAQDPSAGNPLLGLNEIFGLLDITPPPGFTDNVNGVPQLFVYQEQYGPRFGMIVEARIPARMIQSLIQWEPSIQQDFHPFFLESPPPSTLQPFQDMTYKNIDYRYLALDTARDIGIGYLQFEAKRRIVIATSEEMLRLTINRLFAQQ